ncbi:hypothetical protein OHN99_29270 [Streptomyces jietaisiensis]|uniref:Uncharacterized protein n=1 Tax=Streptomyces griseoaurantiacus TaxID=68213 RepID=A0ABZ1VB59_9ACTN|nr:MULTISPECIES: hypothetical protein [Streptomyces]MDX3358277.1 hypothetical protein [Streptomyces sp. ME02-6978.2a]
MSVLRAVLLFVSCVLALRAERVPAADTAPQVVLAHGPGTKEGRTLAPARRR